jgi:ketosteroid isomerase-like protein
MSDKQEDKLLEAVAKAQIKWVNAFNAGDSLGCANSYEEDAVMNAKPFGTFKGRTEIQGFWTKCIEDGLSEVDYIDPQIEVIDETSAILTSKWKMNKAHGVITKELWILQSDGTALLREDNFEAQG